MILGIVLLVVALWVVVSLLALEEICGRGP